MATQAVGNQVPVVDVDPFDLDVIRNPYPFHEMLREAGPVVYIPKYGTYAVGRYDEVARVSKEWTEFSSAAGSGISDIRKPGNWREPGPIVESDPPRHTAIRDVLSKIISPKIIRSWQEQFLTDSAALGDRLLDCEAVDGARDIAEAFVMEVFPKSLGLKEPNRRNMVIVGDYNFCALGPKNSLFEKAAKDLEEISDWFESVQSRDDVAPGSFSDQVYRAEDAGDLPPGVAKGLVRTMLRGGMDTTISGLASALMLMSERPGLWRELRENRAKLKLIFEETIRLETPIQSHCRTTAKEVEFDGLVVPVDSKVHLFLGAANRDPRRWSNPDQFDISRSPAGHLAFGRGVHVCIGQMIARMEAESLLGALLDRFARIEPTGAPVYRPLNTLRTIDHLPLRLIPA